MRGMSTGSTVEAIIVGEVPVLPGAEEDGLIKEVTPKYLIGKTEEELEEIVLSFGEVNFLYFLSIWKIFNIHGGRVNESET